jgi:hypothetical protein
VPCCSGSYEAGPCDWRLLWCPEGVGRCQSRPDGRRGEEISCRLPRVMTGLQALRASPPATSEPPRRSIHALRQAGHRQWPSSASGRLSAGSAGSVVHQHGVSSASTMPQVKAAPQRLHVLIDILLKMIVKTLVSLETACCNLSDIRPFFTEKCAGGRQAFVVKSRPSLNLEQS